MAKVEELGTLLAVIVVGDQGRRQEVPKGSKSASMRGKILQITVGAICEGIEAKRFPARQNGNCYSIKRHHLIKYALRQLSENRRRLMEFGAEA